jgi:hypothetical protein
MTQLALTLEFLLWVADRPRSYGETMEAWRTNCPRMPIWENAVSEGLVRLEAGGSMRERKVVLTLQGRAFLASGQGAPSARLAPAEEARAGFA